VAADVLLFVHVAHDGHEEAGPGAEVQVHRLAGDPGFAGHVSHADPRSSLCDESAGDVEYAKPGG
jgi:hypothetical protein